MCWCVVLLLTAFLGWTIASERPHIILIVADDLGWNDVAFHGSNEIPTPNIDALAYSGVIFDRHYTQESCTPSRASLLTGQYPIRLGFQGTPMRPGEDRTIPHDAKTLPRELQKLGYRTHLVGKWHLGAGRRNNTPVHYGYDSHYGYWFGYVGYFNHRIAEGNMDGIDWFNDLTPIDEPGYATDLFTKRSLEIIDNHPLDEPLFLSINHLAAHTGKTVGVDETVLETEDEQAVNRKFSKIPDKRRRLLADIVSRMDSSVGEVMLRLYNRNMLQNSVVVFLSDNGGPTRGRHSTSTSNYPLRGIKMTLYEGGIRVPAAIYSPYFANSGRIFPNLFHISDWAPTLYSAAGGDSAVFKDVDGIDQWMNIAMGWNVNDRTELLVNINEIVGASGYIGYNGRFKLVQSVSEPYDNYTGSPGSYNPNYVTSVMTSDTNYVISKLNRYQRWNYLKSVFQPQMKNCRRSEEPPACNEPCLFDLFLDPCESRNVAEQNPYVLQQLQERLDYYRTQLVPQQNADVNPISDPANCNGMWYNWLEGAEGCYLTRSQ